MIYTIGHAASYLEAIRQRGRIFKLGKTDQYPGGYAFETVKDAHRRIDEAYPVRGFAVFGLDVDWDRDTEPNREGGWWHNLLIDAKIIVLQEGERM